MRRVMWGLLGLVFVSDALAADYPEYLRGSTVEAPAARYNWAGIYFGGQWGYNSASINLSEAARRQVRAVARQSFLEGIDVDGVERHVSDWLSIPRQGALGSAYGGFVGWNSQWGDVVIGAELNYNRTSLSAAGSDIIGRFITSDDFGYSVTVSGSASATITDYATLRGRAGYAFGWILPYVTGGIAFARANYTATGSVGYPTPVDMLPSPTPPDQPRTVPPGFLTTTSSESKNGVLSVGYAFGAGVDIGLLPNVFVRAEYEHLEFGNFGGITASLNAYRLGAAVKF